MNNINQELLNYITDSNSDFFKKYVNFATRSHSEEDISNFLSNINEFFKTRLDEKRSMIALKIIHYILKENDMEGFSLIIKNLMLKEFEGDFYGSYRDHTSHELLLFFLGCYIYEKVPDFKEKYEKQHIKELEGVKEDFKTGFFYQWSCIALFHDFGYFFDVSEDDKVKNSKLQNFFETLEEYFRNYLVRESINWKLINPNESSFETKKESVINLQKFLIGDINFKYINNVESALLINDLINSKPYLDNTRYEAFDILDKFCLKNYPHYEGIFKPYFDSLNQIGAPYNEPYIKMWDHGISSAILFMKLCVFGFMISDSINRITKSGVHLSGDLRDILQQLNRHISNYNYDKEIFENKITSSALVMAVHNLRFIQDLKHYKEEKYSTKFTGILKRLKEVIFPVSIDDNFLIYLIMITDQLQDWDRYKVIKSGKENSFKILESYHIKLGLKDGKCVFRFANKDWVTDRAKSIQDDLDMFAKDYSNYIAFEYEK